MILVTGGGGFIGSHVCRLLAAHGHDVVAMDQDFATRLPCRTAQGDLTAPDFLAGLLHAYSFDCIIHLASMRNSESQQRPDDALRVNIAGALSLLQLAQQFNVPKFIYASSISAYGPKNFAQYGEVSESEPAAPGNVYGLCKRYVEMVGEQVKRQGRLEFVAVRIAMVVGAGVKSSASAWRGEIFEKLHDTQPVAIRLPFSAHEFIPLIHVADVAEIMRRLVENERTQHTIYNTPCDNWQCRELADAIAAFNPNVKISLAPAIVRGDPEAIDGRRFTQEFDFTPLSVKERLRLAIA
jgi:nucleoside-diphosphate-sugar epimerase